MKYQSRSKTGKKPSAVAAVTTRRIQQSSAVQQLITRDPKDQSAEEIAEARACKTRFERYIKPRLEQFQIDAYYAFLGMIEYSSRHSISSSLSNMMTGAQGGFTSKDPWAMIARRSSSRHLTKIISAISTTDALCLAMIIEGKKAEEIGRAIDGFQAHPAASAAGIARIRACLENLAPHVGAAKRL